MTTTDRLVRLQQLRAELAALLTPEEARTYPALAHLNDLLHDMHLDVEEAA